MLNHRNAKQWKKLKVEEVPISQVTQKHQRFQMASTSTFYQVI